MKVTLVGSKHKKQAWDDGKVFWSNKDGGPVTEFNPNQNWKKDGYKSLEQFIEANKESGWEVEN